MRSIPKFWVVGGEYTDTSFNVIHDGKYQAVGPFSSYQSAFDGWRKLTEMSRHCAYTRFTIAEAQS